MECRDAEAGDGEEVANAEVAREGYELLGSGSEAYLAILRRGGPSDQAGLRDDRLAAVESGVDPEAAATVELHYRGHDDGGELGLGRASVCSRNDGSRRVDTGRLAPVDEPE